MNTIRDNVLRVRERVAATLARAGRGPAAATIVAVTKTFDADTVRAIVEAGVTDIGENRVQEMLTKVPLLGDTCRWHLVGPLQRNKAGKALDVVHLFHGIEDVRTAAALDRLAGERGMRARVLLEVNTSRETSKHGVNPESAPGVAEQIASLPHTDWLGLMTIGPLDAGPASTRECFRHLAAIASDLRSRTGLALPELSMGMSDDFEVALEEGATLVRLGRVIGGDRSAPGG